jgi:hypothetical protein
MKKENFIELKEQGYTIVRNLVNENWLDLLREAIDKAFIEHRETQLIIIMILKLMELLSMYY